MTKHITLNLNSDGMVTSIGDIRLNLLEDLKADLQQTKEYGDFLNGEISGRLTDAGLRHLEHIRFFNLGYRSCLEMIIRKLEEE